MNRRHFIAVFGGVSLTVAGCTEGSNEGNGRLNLVVQNERAESMTVRIEVTDEEGTVYADETARLDDSVARTFEVDVGTDGRHEALVEGDEWGGSLAWNAGTCVRYDGTVRVTDERVEVAGECPEYRE